MTVLPEPSAATAAGQAHNPLSDSVMQAAVRDFLHQTSYDNPDLPSHKDGTQVGDTPPVDQPDSRIAPQWAVGVAIASIGVGAGATGLGCAAWLAFKGLSMVSVPGLERFAWIIIAPFAGFAMAATALGCLIGRAKRVLPAETHNYISGDVHVDQRNVENKSAGVWVKNTNQQ